VLAGGKRRYLYGRTRQEVAGKLTSALRGKELGVPTAQGRQTVAQFLDYLLEIARPTLEETTFVRYEEYARLHTKPYIESVRLANLTPQHLQKLYADKLSEGLSPTSLHHLHAAIHRALGLAVR
jgi:integrase